ncbi:cytochrome C peroxidase, partial [Candidatus Thiomargarita nelsonii]
MFEAAFGGENPMTADNTAKAIAAYERTLITPNSSYDRYAKGDKTALTEQQLKGMNTFAESGCIACHSGPNFSGPNLPMGMGWFMKFPTFTDSEYDEKYRLMEDMGRFEATKKEADKYMWRVPTKTCWMFSSISSMTTRSKR